ncbi:MAG: DUF4364 family protein [Clostridia bacterium]|nr:DUF4364 family protein [Clostridia bacterium]
MPDETGKNEILNNDELGFDAFSAGVMPGGLRSTAQIRVLIAYLVNNLAHPLPKDSVCGILQIHGLANYFEINEALDDLIKTGNIETDSDNCLRITELGKAAVNELQRTIPKSVREKALNDALTVQTLERRKNENGCIVEKSGNGYNVTFSITDGDDTLMKLTVYAADGKQVEIIKDNFFNDPVGLYAGIVSKLFD